MVWFLSKPGAGCDALGACLQETTRRTKKRDPRRGPRVRVPTSLTRRPVRGSGDRAGVDVIPEAREERGQLRHTIAGQKIDHEIRRATGDAVDLDERGGRGRGSRARGRGGRCVRPGGVRAVGGRAARSRFFVGSSASGRGGRCLHASWCFCFSGC